MLITVLDDIHMSVESAIGSSTGCVSIMINQSFMLLSIYTSTRLAPGRTLTVIEIRFQTQFSG